MAGSAVGYFAGTGALSLSFVYWGCAALKKIDLCGCHALRALPDLSSRKALNVEYLPGRLEQQWEANGRKACSV